MPDILNRQGVGTVTFKWRPYDPDRPNTRTPAQNAATDRNFHIFRLRGLYTQMSLLTGKRREAGQRLVDHELAAMGAATDQQHREANFAKWAKRNGDDIPF